MANHKLWLRIWSDAITLADADLGWSEIWKIPTFDWVFGSTEITLIKNGVAEKDISYGKTLNDPWPFIQPIASPANNSSAAGIYNSISCYVAYAHATSFGVKVVCNTSSTAVSSLRLWWVAIDR